MSNLDYHTQNQIFSGVKITQSLAEAERAKKRESLLFLGIGAFALTLVWVILILNAYVFFIAKVSGGSMVPTLVDGDTLVTNRHKQPEIDSIVTINHKKNNGEYELWIKRVIALGGDTVEIKNGYVFVNGVKKDEPYINNKSITYPQEGGERKWVLEHDELFYLGDNRTVSSDARIYGPCKLGDVVGVVEGWSLWLNDLF